LVAANTIEADPAVKGAVITLSFDAGFHPVAFRVAARSQAILTAGLVFQFPLPAHTVPAAPTVFWADVGSLDGVPGFANPVAAHCALAAVLRACHAVLTDISGAEPVAALRWDRVVGVDVGGLNGIHVLDFGAVLVRFPEVHRFNVEHVRQTGVGRWRHLKYPGPQVLVQIVAAR